MIRSSLLTFLLISSFALGAPSASQLDFLQRLSAAALKRTAPETPKVTYDGSYFALKYPGGDPPVDRGVCTDVVIRSYRSLGIDLQKDVHEDMAKHFALYPTKYGHKKPDTNIDHRRVPNLRLFFQRRGESLPVTDKKEDYLPGDLVTWTLPGGLDHIGVVVDRRTFFRGVPLVVHNIGAGDVVEDVLFSWKIDGHYRYYGTVPKEAAAK